MVRNSMRSIKSCVAWGAASVGVGVRAVGGGLFYIIDLYDTFAFLRGASGGCLYKAYYVKYALGHFWLARFFALGLWMTLCDCGGSLPGCCGQAHCVWRWQLAKNVTDKMRSDWKSGAGMCAKEVRGTSTIAHMTAGDRAGYLDACTDFVNLNLFKYRNAPLFLIFTSNLLAAILVVCVSLYINFTGRCHFVDLL